jgi:hypothetical protein
MCQRALDELQCGGDGDAAWQHWKQAKELVGESNDVLAARQQLIQTTLLAAEEDLLHGAAQRVVQRLQCLKRHGQGGEARATLEEVTQRLESARRLSRSGRFADAQEQVDFAAHLRPDLQAVDFARKEIHQHREQCRQLDERLHRAMQQSRWDEALVAAESLLDLAPEHRIAATAKRQAWARVGAQSTRSAAAAATGLHAQAPGDTAIRGDTVTPAASERALLWIDAVGGYLLCLAPEVVLGQAGGAGVDLPILGDVSRRHAKLRRQGDEYLLEPLHAATINGKPAGQVEMLEDGDEIGLGTRVRLRFRRPHPLSCSARLEFISRHRTQPSVDAVIMMAESCVLGPGEENHVVCRGWSDDLVLFRKDSQLHCRAMHPLEVDGRRFESAAPLNFDSQVTGEDFSLSLEPL